MKNLEKPKFLDLFSVKNDQGSFFVAGMILSIFLVGTMQDYSFRNTVTFLTASLWLSQLRSFSASSPDRLFGAS